MSGITCIFCSIMYAYCYIIFYTERHDNWQYCNYKTGFYNLFIMCSCKDNRYVHPGTPNWQFGHQIILLEFSTRDTRMTGLDVPSQHCSHTSVIIIILISTLQTCFCVYFYLCAHISLCFLVSVFGILYVIFIKFILYQLLVRKLHFIILRT